MSTLLIVAPPSSARGVLERGLSESGQRGRGLTDGDEAMTAWRAERHELVIVDESVPRINGMTMSARMKTETQLGFMPVVLVTARNDVATHVQALSSADDVVTTPIDIDRLLARVGALLRTRAIVDELRIARAESEARTHVDATTGLRNRAFLGERINEEFKRSVRYNDPLSLILLAVEGWRALMEQRGGSFVDRILQGTAAATMRSLRQIDVVARYGASELAALLPNTHLVGALTCADRLRREMAATKVDDLSPIVSMGIAFYPGKDVNDASDLMRMAARALERAREEGPGSICLYQHQGYLFQPK
jgi:two-component system cell cycle response regulator